MTSPVFQPFTDRLSRDIRNDLSESLVKVLRKRSLAPAEKVSNRYLALGPAPCYREYIEARIASYAAVLDKISADDTDPLLQGLVLWDERLFFEVHEVLEHAWLKAAGEEKLFLQAMIRAAGVYIKRDAGYSDTARRIAAKALPILERNRNRLLRYTDPALLVDALKNLSVNPPQLLK